MIGLRGRGKRSCMNTRAFFSSFPLSWAHRGGNGRGAGGYEKSYFSRRSVLCKICGYNFWVWALDNLFLWVRAWVGGIYGVPQSALGVCVEFPFSSFLQAGGGVLGGGAGERGASRRAFGRTRGALLFPAPLPNQWVGRWYARPSARCRDTRASTHGWLDCMQEDTPRPAIGRRQPQARREKGRGRRTAEAVVGAGSRSV